MSIMRGITIDCTGRHVLRSKGSDMQWYECTVTFSRARKLICDVQAKSASEARLKARLKAVENGIKSRIKTITAKPLKG